MMDKPINPRPRCRPPKPIPKLDETPERVARAIFSAVKPPNPTVRVPKVHTRKPKSAQ